MGEKKEEKTTPGSNPPYKYSSVRGAPAVPNPVIMRELPSASLPSGRIPIVDRSPHASRFMLAVTVPGRPTITRYRFWNISIDGFSIGRDPSSSIPFSAIVDTGSSINLLPEYIVNQYYKRIPDSYKSTQHGGYIFPCTQTSIIPDFSLKIGQYIAVTPGQLLKFSSNGTHCFGGIQSSPFSSLNILGEVFLKNQYVIFFDDDRNARIGIAPQA
ncbi:hypothetical protein TMatcc_006680 [Talaromyces marneffei ATCC 18224]|uniref:uncharacterized protein n=1 Tax=Talaromyces marneffei TaxID=37727 RepID=UPI0012A9D5F5|nr:uncharacterized protein EYB26_002379 [Talaromyces marneffei]KAE8553833.1 hypothetical protein EYB25_002371 [Talaromyces marneffei]QGA14723.1 hypothetical protein EYB26_002379 [Talaromyces marneffei]